MLTFLIAAALTVANPTPPAPDQQAPNADEVAKSVPLVCEARFIEEVRLKASGLDRDHAAKVIDIFADKEKLTPEMKSSVESLCAFFDLGASYIINQLNEQAKVSRPHGIGHDTDKIASFTR